MHNIAFVALFICVVFAWCRGKPIYNDGDGDGHTADDGDRYTADDGNRYATDDGGKYTADDGDRYTTDDNEKDALYQLPQNGELFEGDIVMDDRLRRAVWGEKSKKSALREAEKSLLWPRGQIHYEIDEKFPRENRKMLKEAMAEFHARTCIRFIPRSKTNPEKAFIYYTAQKDECSSSIGRSGRGQIINLGRHCLVLGTFEHENMHALGFIHEHSRPDRDDYISVIYKNIERKEWNNFNKYKFDQVDNLKAKFNFASILLYRNDAFTNNGNKTIVALVDPKLEFGQREKFSIGDVKEINNLYNCTREKKDPNYHGLFEEYHLQSRRKKKKKKKRKKKKDLAKQRIMDYLRRLERRLRGSY